MSDSVGTYSDTANIARVKAGLKGNPGRLQGGNPSPSFTFVDGQPAAGQRASTQDAPQEKLPILDPWVTRRLGGKQ